MDPMEVTFVCANLFERPAKIAAALSMQGAYVDLLTSNGSIQPSWRNYFRNIGTVSTFDEFQQAIARLSASTPIHHFSSGVDGFTVALLNLNKRFVFDYKDVFPELLTLPSEGQSVILDAIIDRDLPVFHRDSQLDGYLARKGKNPPTHYKHIPDFIWPGVPPALVRYGVTHIQRLKKIAFVGNFSIEALEPNFAGQGQISIIEELLRQGLHYYMFPFRHDKLDQNTDAMHQYHNLSRVQSKFFLEGRLPLPKLQIRLREMGWGSLLLAASHFDSLSTKTSYLTKPFMGMPARLSDYFGAGLPIIVSEELVEISDLIKSYGIGLPIAKDDLTHVSKYISECDYPRIKHNVLTFGAELLNPDKWGHMIILYYKEVW